MKGKEMLSKALMSKDFVASRLVMKPRAKHRDGMLYTSFLDFEMEYGVLISSDERHGRTDSDFRQRTVLSTHGKTHVYLTLRKLNH